MTVTVIAGYINLRELQIAAKLPSMKNLNLAGKVMGDLIDFKHRIEEINGVQTPEFEAFLASEGLPLLAAYRSIEDASVRISIMQMITRIAAALPSTGPATSPLEPINAQ